MISQLCFFFSTFTIILWTEALEICTVVNFASEGAELALQYSDHFILALDFAKIIWYFTFNFRNGNFELQNAVIAKRSMLLHSYLRSVVPFAKM